MCLNTLIQTTTTLAYIGPGGGIALLGPLIGLVLAVVGAVAMIAIWPLRILWKRLRRPRTVTQRT
jgi:hypothetical protein